HHSLVILHRVHDLCPRWFHDSVENLNERGGASNILLSIGLTEWAMQIEIRAVALASHILQVASELFQWWLSAILQAQPKITVGAVCLGDRKPEAFQELTSNVEDGVIGSADG